MQDRFAKVWRKQKTQKTENLKEKLVKTVEESHPKDSVNFLQSSSRLYESDYPSGDDNMAATKHHAHQNWKYPNYSEC